MRYSLWGLALALCVLLTAAFVAGCSGQPTEQPTPTERFAAISSGTLHTCGLREDGSAVCWGNNAYGEASPPEGETFTAISSGSSHSCGLREDGSAVCWGYNRHGQSSPPERETFAAISSGTGYTCGLREDGSTRSWELGKVFQWVGQRQI